MLYCSYIDTDNHYSQGLFYEDEYNYYLKSGKYKKVLFTTNFKAANNEKDEYYYKINSKEAARTLAQDLLAADAETINNNGYCLSWGEWWHIQSILTQIARRFGLVCEFRENAII